MNLPDRYPVVEVDESRGLSGPDPALPVLRRRCDQVMSPQWMVPSQVALRLVPNGHALEIPMALWSASSATGTSSGSIALIPMGARCGLRPEPNKRPPGHAKKRRTAGTAIRAIDREYLPLCKVHQLDTSLLMGAPQCSHDDAVRGVNRVSGPHCFLVRCGWLVSSRRFSQSASRGSPL